MIPPLPYGAGGIIRTEGQLYLQRVSWTPPPQILHGTEREMRSQLTNAVAYRQTKNICYALFQASD